MHNQKEEEERDNFKSYVRLSFYLLHMYNVYLYMHHGPNVEWLLFSMFNRRLVVTLMPPMKVVFNLKTRFFLAEIGRRRRNGQC